MRYAVYSEPSDQDSYDMTNLVEVEVVEAEDENDAVRNSFIADMLGYHIWTVRVKDDWPLGPHDGHSLSEEALYVP